LYGYCMSNPFNNTDKSGNDPVDADKWKKKNDEAGNRIDSAIASLQGLPFDGLGFGPTDVDPNKLKDVSMQIARGLLLQMEDDFSASDAMKNMFGNVGNREYELRKEYLMAEFRVWASKETKDLASIIEKKLQKSQKSEEIIITRTPKPTKGFMVPYPDLTLFQRYEIESTYTVHLSFRNTKAVTLDAHIANSDQEFQAKLLELSNYSSEETSSGTGGARSAELYKGVGIDIVSDEKKSISGTTVSNGFSLSTVDSVSFERLLELKGQGVAVSPTYSFQVKTKRTKETFGGSQFGDIKFSAWRRYIEVTQDKRRKYYIP
jgi:hypothetical protein